LVNCLKTVDKDSIRQSVRSHLKALSADQKRENEEKIQKQLLELFQRLKLENPALSQKSFIIGAFAPMSLEVNWLNNLPKIYQGQLAFPRSKSPELEGMDFYQSSFEELEMSSDFGVKLKVPKGSAPKCFPEIQLVPGLAFGKDGSRLGKGKGYYDRYLAKHPCIKIGLCFELQLFETLPSEKHDQKMDYVVTESQLIVV
jgi:5-formyltetrahydrofolate cyclo-ligase